MKEKKVEEKLRLDVKKMGGIAFKFVSPGRNGVADRIVVMPGGKIWFVEMKAPGKGLSPLQKIFKRDVERLGCEHRKVATMEAEREFINEIKQSI